MKTISIFILTIFFTNSIQCMCSWNRLSAFPIGNTIKTNSIFVIDGYGESQEVIKNINKKYAVCLKSNTSQIKLIVKEIRVGQFSLTQAVLFPESPLIVGQTYTLTIDSLPEYEYLNRWNEKEKQNELVTYTVIAGIDTIKPIFKVRPKELKKTFIQYGCGPEINVKFSCPVLDSSEYLIKATVKNLLTHKQSTYYVQADKKSIEIGHGMCSGAFDFGKGTAFEIEFSIMDASGNYSTWKGNRIKFNKPTAANTIR
ncbi:MAG: hypothetical protein PSX81_04085 [bacterium]|nr:hypothetical protein [bacterium]